MYGVARAYHHVSWAGELSWPDIDIGEERTITHTRGVPPARKVHFRQLESMAIRIRHTVDAVLERCKPPDMIGRPSARQLRRLL